MNCNEVKDMMEDYLKSLGFNVATCGTELSGHIDGVLGYAINVESNGRIENGGMPVLCDDGKIIFQMSITMFRDVYNATQDELDRLCRDIRKYADIVFKESRRLMKERRLKMIEGL